MSTTDSTPYGYCHCGCGEKTRLAPRNHTATGVVKGQPNRYVRGHQRRLTSGWYREQDCGYETPCWVWQLGTCSRGYARMKRDGRMQQAHRAFYVERFGPLGEHLHLHHRCENRSCVNPDHLEPLTQLDHRREHSNVTLDIARAIRRRYVPGVVTARMLADEHGITVKQVRHIVAGRVWREEAITL